tara:strand:+ start:199 stop:1176 length:978 start_codon:yes stop_codon:yes gene_type:complete
MNTEPLFNIQTEEEFNSAALQVFKFQYTKTKVYQEFCNHFHKNDSNVKHYTEIPFLPIQFFKSKKVLIENAIPEITFNSSGTTGTITSKHYVSNVQLYQDSYLAGFHYFYGDITQYCVLALLPSYLEREGSSLIYMADDLIKKSKHPNSGFYLNEIEALVDTLKALEAQKTKVILIGVSFALLDVAEQYHLNLQHTIIMETGGMKGRRKELIREELHQELQKGFGVSEIHSEYGMTELLSQGYSKGNGIFNTPPWMKILVRDTEDPLTLQSIGKTGGINVIDLANVNSCSFIATQDLGKIHPDHSFEIIGRFDNSDIRGCNLLVL